ncbi:hypothetical protein BJ912DRAFT_934956 [Pholiota molesta]|nr:hypothetical protein BJ912DRAFT_934956 [Pholiota molesta]
MASNSISNSPPLEPVPSFPVSTATTRTAMKGSRNRKILSSPYLHIRPSTILKCSTPNNIKNPGSVQTFKQLFAANDFKARRLRQFHVSSKKRLAAEATQLQEEHRERQILDFAASQGSNWSSMEPQLALALARAARDTLIAEENTLKLRVTECQRQLETLTDDLDYAHVRVQQAHLQVGDLMESLFKLQIPVDYRPLDLRISSMASLEGDDSDDHIGSDSETDSDSNGTHGRGFDATYLKDVGTNRTPMSSSMSSRRSSSQQQERSISRRQGPASSSRHRQSTNASTNSASQLLEDEDNLEDEEEKRAPTKRSSKPDQISYYKGTVPDFHGLILGTKKRFVALSFATGLFFGLEKGTTSLVMDAFDHQCTHDSTQLLLKDVDDYMRKIVKKGLGDARNAVKTIAQSQILTSYGLSDELLDREFKKLDVNDAGPATLVDFRKEKVTHLLGSSDDVEDVNNIYAHGPTEDDRWGHDCAFEILSKFFFAEPTGPGAAHDFIHYFAGSFCLELIAFSHAIIYYTLREWKTGVLINMNLPLPKTFAEKHKIIVKRMKQFDPSKMKTLSSTWFSNATTKYGVPVANPSTNNIPNIPELETPLRFFVDISDVNTFAPSFMMSAHAYDPGAPVAGPSTSNLLLQLETPHHFFDASDVNTSSMISPYMYTYDPGAPVASSSTSNLFGFYDTDGAGAMDNATNEEEKKRKMLFHLSQLANSGKHGIGTQSIDGKSSPHAAISVEHRMLHRREPLVRLDEAPQDVELLVEVDDEVVLLEVRGHGGGGCAGVGADLDGVVGGEAGEFCFETEKLDETHSTILDDGGTWEAEEGHRDTARYDSPVQFSHSTGVTCKTFMGLEATCLYTCGYHADMDGRTFRMPELPEAEDDKQSPSCAMAMQRLQYMCHYL